ncbi:YuzL-like protein [Geobacillus sp. C56-T2]|nr:YuzL-like protein [Geobacillus sp. C56-T2]
MSPLFKRIAANGRCVRLFAAGAASRAVGCAGIRSRTDALSFLAFAYGGAPPGTIKTEVIGVPKRKKDRSKTGISAPDVRGQGTTQAETGAYELDSARKKTKVD